MNEQIQPMETRWQRQSNRWNHGQVDLKAPSGDLDRRVWFTHWRPLCLLRAYVHRVSGASLCEAHDHCWIMTT